MALELASRHKSEFLASMSHELRTPLNAVLGFSEVLLERMFGDINERQEEYLRDIHGSGKHLLELLNEILDLSKVEAGRMEIDYSAFDLRVLLEEAVAMLRERATAHGIDLSVDVEPGLVHAYSDQLRLKQVVLNLVTNAVKFTGDGGSVAVRARRTPVDIEVTVSDTGVGIPQADRERIFESFQQGGRGASREEGTGLGLTLSRRIVELLGGRMWLESEVGVGSTFGFTLPSRTSDDAGRADVDLWEVRGRGDRGRPALARSLHGLPRRRFGAGHRRARRTGRARSRAPEPAERGAARHPAAGHGRLGGSDHPQAGPRRPATSP